MNDRIINEITKNLGISTKQVTEVLKLLEEGNTIPFIARYRKEQTGNLDEEQINEINKYYEYQVNLLKRKEDIIRLIDEKGMLTPELNEEILKAEKLVDVEDLYRPFKEKKKTKATEAIAKGLEPFAKWMFSFPYESIEEEAKKYLNDDVKSIEEAIEGAKYIIAEIISDEPTYRKDLRAKLLKNGLLITKAKKNAAELDEKKVYQMYYDYSELASKAKPHRILAINRAESEKVITVKIDVEKDIMIDYLNSKVIKKDNSTATGYVQEAIEDAYKRLIFPSLEREIRSEMTEKAEQQAIIVFGDNLQNLLLQPPLKGYIVLGVDPAFRTGCKLCIINEQGTFLTKGVIYPHEKSLGQIADPRLIEEAKRKVLNLVKDYKVEVIAIGNGTASRETETFISNLIKENQLSCKYVIVSEAGASVYSASEIAREEFPDFSVEERSAASIARRLQDPLSELVKIDPKSIGVGQYQHDVSPKELNNQLNFVVTQAVNSVGVNLNTASKELLKYVSGLTNKTAENIVKYRNKNAKFNSRNELKKVAGLGDKAYEQSVGFLRINDGKEPLDMTSIHPESYEIAKNIMKTYNISSEMFGKDSIKPIINGINKSELSKQLNVDSYTLNDILDSFISPLRDPRDEYPQPILKSDILKMEDLRVGMELQGTVRNVTDFGAFVDIGLKNDGLVHISKLSKSYVKHPKDVVSVGDIVKVWVLNIDNERQKVGLSMIQS